MQEIRIKFVDFWKGFDEASNFIVQALSKRFKVVNVEDTPDYLFYSCFGEDHYSHTAYDCIKIFYTGENLVPNFNECDYALGFEFMDFGDRYLRHPLFALHRNIFDVAERDDIIKGDVDQKTGFCNFIYSNHRADPVRDNFFRLLSAYKKVDAAGRHLRNTDHIDKVGKSKDFTQNKIDFQSRYKFSIAFENSECPGYSTEKILDAFAARTIPIYWGNKRIIEDFNSEAFINAYDFEDLPALVNEVIRIDTDDSEFARTLNAPVFASSYNLDTSHTSELESFLANILTQPLSDARRRPKYGRVRMLELQHMRKNRGFRRVLKRRG